MKSPLPGGHARRNKTVSELGTTRHLLRPAQAHCSLLCDALHRASSNPERPSTLQNPAALRKLPSHLPFGRIVDSRPARTSMRLSTANTLITIKHRAARHGEALRYKVPPGADHGQARRTVEVTCVSTA